MLAEVGGIRRWPPSVSVTKRAAAFVGDSKQTSYKTMKPTHTIKLKLQAASCLLALTALSPSFPCLMNAQERVSTPVSAAAFAMLPAPTNLVATATSSTTVHLTWSAPAGGVPIKIYFVYRGISDSVLPQLGLTTKASYWDSAGSPGGTYYYAIAAEDAQGILSPISTVAKITLPAPPSAPANLVATPDSATRASLTWSPAAAGGLPVLYYQVFRGISPSTLSLVATVELTSYMDTSVNPKTTYYYAVKAEDSGADLSPMSAVAKVTLLTPPSAPSSLVASPTSNTSVALTWSAVAGGSLPVVYYQVFRGISPSNLSQVTTVAQTAYTDSCLSPNTAYYYAVAAIDAGGDVSPISAIVPATTTKPSSAAPFNVLSTTVNSFSPSNTNLPGLPLVDTPSGLLPSIGYQDGTVLNGKTIYFPWQVGTGGSSWVGHIHDAIPQSVILSYNSSAGLSGFGTDTNWTYFELTTLPWYSKGGNQGTNPLPNLPAGFEGGTVAGNMVYPAPIGDLGTGDGGGPYPVLIQYNSLKAINDPTAYETFVPPPMGSTMGDTYGWCTASYDGRFVYYTPLANSVTGHSGNIFRYDTTQPFGNLKTGGVTSAWSNFDMMTAPYNPGGVDPNAEGFQSAAYDGHRYIYFIPFNATLIVRYDTWNGGSGPDPIGFTQARNYITFDPTKLGATGYPVVAGEGSTANLAGFTGSQIVWDAANQNEYLYLVPWATYPNNALNPTLQSTAARVRVGTITGSVWNPIDFASTATSPVSSTPKWEMFDLSSLTRNQAFQCTWPQLQSNPELSAQTSMAGWQEAYTATRSFSGATFPPRVGFVPDTSQFLVEHDVGHHLYDPSGWYVAQVPDTYNYGTMGGGYDAANGILYPSSPNVPLYALQF